MTVEYPMSMKHEGQMKAMQDAVSRLRTACAVAQEDRDELMFTAIRTEHRTNQQSTMRDAIIPMLRALATEYDENMIDARNEAACRMARRMLDAVEDDQWLPYI